MNKRQIISTLALVALSLTGCGSNSPAASTSVLDGTWARSCAAGSGGVGSSSQQKIVYGGGNYSYTRTFFSDGACASTALLVVTESGTFSVGAADATTTAATDVTYTQGAVTATTSGGEGSTLTTAAACGAGVSFTDGAATSISGLTCNGFLSSAATYAANGATIANLFQITGTTLTIGQASGSAEFLGAVSPAAAPTTLSSKTFTQQ